MMLSAQIKHVMEDSGLKKTQVDKVPEGAAVHQELCLAKEPNCGFYTVDGVAYGAAGRQVS